MAQEKDKMSLRMEMAQEGILNSQFTKDGWFVKVKPAYGIEKVAFCFVKKGTKGSGFNVYIDIDTFDNWCDDFLSGRFAHVLAAEKQAGEKYPKFYKFVTGESGSKSVGFANSTTDANMYVVNGQCTIDGKNTYANVPVDCGWLKTTAKYFRRTSAKTFERIVEATVKASQSYRHNLTEDDETYDVGAAENKQAATTEVTTTTPNVTTSQPATTAQHTSAPQAQPIAQPSTATQSEQSPKTPEPKTPKGTLKTLPKMFTTSTVTNEADGSYSFTVKIENGKENYRCVITKDVKEKNSDMLDKFIAKANEKEVGFTMSAIDNNDANNRILYFQNFA